MNLIRYTANDAEKWNAFVANSKNGTFLFDRTFMDYHSDRFTDCSFMFYDEGKLLAVMPANIREETHTLYSHQGLTYGGLIMLPSIPLTKVLECFTLLIEYCKNTLGLKKIIYKPTPYIYSNYPSDEPLYALFRHGAILTGRGISQCIHLENRIKVSELRRRGVKKATTGNYVVKETDDYNTFWNVLNDVLSTYHSTKPVHSATEMELLAKRFPQRAKLFGTFSPDGTMLAGAWVFDCDNVVHTQYLASSDKGKQTGALDMLIMHIIDLYSPSKQYLDFGISTEDGGAILNEGLTFQKEGFGGRGVCYDCWELNI
ncbi:MAG: GNAT family N-acetyltransferase [Bacteroidaceae bacterium]|nr:GNAT family N-acetyltransferase [Bacteroidaceae bacterium]